MQLLRTILIIVLIYYLAKLFMRYIMPLIARYFIRKTITNFEKQGKPAQKKEGEITIETAPKKKSQTDSLGEYVDYEEVDE